MQDFIPGATPHGIEEALLHRLNPRSPLTASGRRFAGCSLVEMGRERLQEMGVQTRGMSRFEVAGLMLRAGGSMSTSDFPAIMANVASKRLRQAYESASTTYQLWARRAIDAPDFRTISVVNLSAMPDLLQTNEHGEFQYGKMSDGKETYSLVTYGRIISLTRQAIVNDDLRAFERLVTAYGNAARRLENRLVYSVLTTNAALADAVALFHASHANLGSGGGSALQASALTTARTAMRVQKGLQSEELNLAPRHLIVPAALEQTAYQLTSANYVPATQGAVSEFRQGGRTSLEPVVEPLLDANSSTAWYLAADHMQVDTVEYCYLSGGDAPQIDIEMGFEVDGMAMRCRHDFAAKAIDYRGLYKSAGA